MKLTHKIVAVLLIMTIFAFNLVIIPVQAGEGCNCDHPHGESGFACYCGPSSKMKPSCDPGDAIISKKSCGLEKNGERSFVPANEFPTLISLERHIHNIPSSVLAQARDHVIHGIELTPLEHPPHQHPDPD